MRTSGTTAHPGRGTLSFLVVAQDNLGFHFGGFIEN